MTFSNEIPGDMYLTRNFSTGMTPYEISNVKSDSSFGGANTVTSDVEHGTRRNTNSRGISKNLNLT